MDAFDVVIGGSFRPQYLHLHFLKKANWLLRFFLQTFEIAPKNNTCFGNRQYAFNRDGTYSNHGQIAITNSDANHILNNVLVSDWVGVASGSGGAPFAASEFGNGINLWQTNLLHTKIANSPLTNSENIEADSVIADPQFADEASYDYRSVAGRNMGSRWNGHVYFDIRNVMVGPGQRVDLGCIQNP